jgi:endonuclease YncB( thermonuclease family)
MESMKARGSAMLFAVLVVATAASADPARIFGNARVLDGDTVIVNGWRVRLKGVDAPELPMPGGVHARDLMHDIVGPEGILVCALTGEKTRGREVGFCTRPDGLDINREIIVRGAALACPRFSRRYVPDERAEARAKLQRASYCLVDKIAVLRKSRRY